MQVRGPLSLRGGERRLCLPAPADLPTAGRVPHGTGWLLLVTAEALTGGIRAWWTQAGKPTRVLQPRQAPLGAHRPCASLAPAGGPAAAARTPLGRICRHDGGWWGAGDLLSVQPPSTTMNARVPTQIQAHRPAGAGLPVQLPRGSRCFSMMASPARTAPPGPPRQWAAPCPVSPQGARVCCSCGRAAPHDADDSQALPPSPPADQGCGALQRVRAGGPETRCRGSAPCPARGVREVPCPGVREVPCPGYLRGALPRGSARCPARGVCTVPCLGDLHGALPGGLRGALPGVQTRLCLPHVLVTVLPGRWLRCSITVEFRLPETRADLGLPQSGTRGQRNVLLGPSFPLSLLLSVQFSPVAQSCPTLCDPMDCSTPGLPVHHQLPEVTQTHVHGVGDAIQPSHPLSSPSPAVNLSQHQNLFK